MKIADLQRMKPLLNLSELARRAGLNDRTLNAKLRRNSELSVTESEALERAFEDVGLNVAKITRNGAGQ